MKTTSLNPPDSEWLWLRHSRDQVLFSEYLQYIRNKSAAKSDASSPPAPALISMIVFLPTSGSGGSIATSRFSFSFFICGSSTSISSWAASANSSSDSKPLLSSSCDSSALISSKVSIMPLILPWSLDNSEARTASLKITGSDNRFSSSLYRCRKGSIFGRSSIIQSCLTKD